MASIIQTRRDTAANWTSVNPILANGEAGLETDTKRIKYGDGVTAWSTLDYYVANVPLNDLADVAAPSPTVGDRLEWDGSNWINSPTYKPLTINAQTGTAYTFALSDAGINVEMTNAGAIVCTVPDNATVAFAIGTEIIVDQNGAGQVTFAGSVGVFINSAGGLLSLTAQYSAGTLIKKATDTWLLVGDIV